MPDAGYWILQSYKDSKSVTPAKAGVHNYIKRLDSGVRRNDDPRQIGIFYKKNEK
jgi:hypothetical protein